ncbi:MAG TPA: heme o synthase [Longimicrobiales bacterium]|nr:heme o synthase [Longimicrobiales bacterium]
MLTAAAPAPIALRARLSAYVELTKPGIVRMVLITAGTGFFLAGGLSLDVVRLLHMLLGMALVASGSCGLNEYVERDADARMHRTAARPIPSGRMSPFAALLFSSAISAAGLLYLALFLGMLTTSIVALSLASYVFVYTPLKRITWLATPVGAVPGALPILAGWTAGGGGVTAPGLALFGILFLWQMPHFYALAWMYREDYARGGFRLITSLENAEPRIARQIMLFSSALLAVSMLPSMLGLTGPVYLGAAMLLGIAFLYLSLAMALQRTDHRALRLFLGSVTYLPLLLIIMVVDRLLF